MEIFYQKSPPFVFVWSSGSLAELMGEGARGRGGEDKGGKGRKVMEGGKEMGGRKREKWREGIKGERDRGEERCNTIFKVF